MKVEIRQAVPSDRRILRLIRQLDDYQSKMYPPESNHLDSPQELERSGAYLVGAYVDADAVGIGAVKCFGDGEYGEIKRVYVEPDRRGCGISKMIMKVLEDHAAERGCRSLMLETGIHQKEAIGLYQALGYRYRGAFGDYPPDDPLSVFMEKTL